MKIFIRVDSGEAIGTGHVMRCLTLSDMLLNTNTNITFISRPHKGNIIETIKKRGYEVIILDEPEFAGGSDEVSWLGTSIEKDAQECKKYISNADWIIIDHYALNVDWGKNLRSHTDKIFVIDDLANREHDCDVLLDQNFYLDKDIRYNNLVKKDCKLLLGPNYALLRPEFYQAARDYQYSVEIKNLFVFFGGVDSAGMTLKTLECLKDYNFKTHIVCGSANQYKIKIKEICDQNKNFVFYEYVDNIAELMASCDAAIGAGGTTQWERACIGIPSLVFSIANNQTKICEDMSEVGNILYGGVVYNAKSIEFILKTFIENQFLRKLLHIKSKSLIDSKFNLSSLFFQENTVQLRKATIEDCKNIYDWRNHQQTRKYSGNSEIIPYETHQAWYQTAIIDEKKIFLIARDNDKEIGVLRYDFMSDTILISIYLNPQYNGYGYGKKILESGEVYLKTNKICFKTMVAEVLNDNTPSHKLFKKCGFKNYKSVYKKILNES